MGDSRRPSENILFGTLAVGSLASGWFLGYPEALLAATVAMCTESFLAWRKNRNVLLAAFGAIYVIFPFLALIWLRTQPVIGATAVVWLLVVVWATDVFAYLFGRTLGGMKLAPSISPQKTWSGFVGGISCAGLVGGATGAYLLSRHDFVFDTWTASILWGIFISFTAQIGDLGESWLKRLRMLKDSGNVIPGHGGLLDRVDGLMISTPIMAVLVWTTGLGS